MVDQFPDLFEIGRDDDGSVTAVRGARAEAARRRRRRRSALQRSTPACRSRTARSKSLDLADENVEKALVHGGADPARHQRQQLLATHGADGHQPHRRHRRQDLRRRSCTTSRRATTAAAAQRDRVRLRATTPTATSRTRVARGRVRAEVGGGRQTTAGAGRRIQSNDRDGATTPRASTSTTEQAGHHSDERGQRDQSIARCRRRPAGRRGRRQLQERLPAAREDGDSLHDRGRSRTRRTRRRRDPGGVPSARTNRPTTAPRGRLRPPPPPAE